MVLVMFAFFVAVLMLGIIFFCKEHHSRKKSLKEMENIVDVSIMKNCDNMENLRSS